MHAILLVVIGIIVAVVGAPVSAFGQPLGWILEAEPPWNYGPTDRLIVFDLNSGSEVARFEAPLEVRYAAGAVTPDGQYYLLATSAGLARYRTRPVVFDRNIGPPGPVTDLSVAPSGTQVHVMGPHGRAVVDWRSGALIRVECCDTPDVYFTPEGSVRIDHVRSITNRVERVTAFSEPAGTRLWEHEIPYYPCGPGAAGRSYFALSCHDWDYWTIYLWNVSTGAEQNVDLVGLIAWHSDRLLISHRTPLGDATRLSSYDPQARTTRLIAERAGPGEEGPWSITVAPDDSFAVWQTRYYGGVSEARTAYDLIDLGSGTRLATAELSGFQEDFDISLEPVCELDVPAARAAPPEGGMVNIPVVPEPTCSAWSVAGQPGVLNPGRYVGPATIFVRTWPNTEAAAKSIPVRIGRQTVLITQPSGVPAAPVLEAAVSGNRVALSWMPAIGAGITAFIVRGAIAGGTVTDVLQLPAALRGWTSPSLPPGSYQVELLAANGAGRSPPSNRRAFSIGAPETPEPPSGLTASVADDRVGLSWTPASTSPAPAGFIVEASASGSPAFAPVARVDGPSFVATRVPAGTWDVRVRSATAGGVSEPSAAISVTTAPCMAAPGPPQAPWALWTAPAVSVRWSAPSTGSVEDYVIEVGSASGRADLAQLIVPSVRLTHTEQVSALVAFVRVRARNACGTGVPSGEVAVVIY
jgi:hypothetical protein